MDCQKWVYLCYQIKDPFLRWFSSRAIISLLISTKSWTHFLFIPAHTLKWTFKSLSIHHLNLRVLTQCFLLILLLCLLVLLISFSSVLEMVWFWHPQSQPIDGDSSTLLDLAWLHMAESLGFHLLSSVHTLWALVVLVEHKYFNFQHSELLGKAWNGSESVVCTEVQRRFNQHKISSLKDIIWEQTLQTK